MPTAYGLFDTGVEVGGDNSRATESHLSKESMVSVRAAENLGGLKVIEDVRVNLCNSLDKSFKA